MSATDLSPPSRRRAPPTPTRTAPRGPARRAGPGSGRRSSAAVLLGSAAAAAGQAGADPEGPRRGPARAGQIKLADVPLTLGPWKGETTELDPMIARATGADQIVTRRYVNQETGTTIDAILLYGPAADVYLHSPEVCYPAAGYAQVAGPETRVVKAARLDGPVPLRWSTRRGRGAGRAFRRCITPGGITAAGRPTSARRSTSSGSPACTRSSSRAASRRGRSVTWATRASRSSTNSCLTWNGGWRHPSRTPRDGGPRRSSLPGKAEHP